MLGKLLNNELLIVDTTATLCIINTCILTPYYGFVSDNIDIDARI
jgi:hypothetical protein